MRPLRRAAPAILPRAFSTAGVCADARSTAPGRLTKNVVQRYSPGNGSTTGIFHPAWFILGSTPSSNGGGGCGGDSGSGIFPASGADADIVLAVHVGGYRVGFNNVICRRLTALNMRVDIPQALDFITSDPHFG